MRVSDALGQIAQIHEQLAKTEVYRGFHPQCVALSGLLGLAAAALQPFVISGDDPTGFVHYWLVVAAASALTGFSATLHAYLFRDDVFARRRTRHVAGQFVPCIAAGVGLTLILGRGDLARVALLPGLWATVFGLGVFAARPYLPHATGWVGLFFLGCGALLLAAAPAELARAGWGVGGVFGAGQLATAWVLHRNVEREDA